MNQIFTLSDRYEQLSEEVESLQKQVAPEFTKRDVQISIENKQATMAILIRLINEFGDLDHDLYMETGEKKPFVKINLSPNYSQKL